LGAVPIGDDHPGVRSPPAAPSGPAVPPARRHVAQGIALATAEIAVVTVVIAALRRVVSVEDLAGLYVLAILPTAIGWGFGWALVVALASTLTFDLLFASPATILMPTDLDTVAFLGISVVSAFVVSRLAGRVQRRAREAERLALEVRRIAEEQAALRRVATSVARGAPPEEVFASVTEEVGRLLGADSTVMSRHDADGAVSLLGRWDGTDHAPAGTTGRPPRPVRSVLGRVLDTHGPARTDDAVRLADARTGGSPEPGTGSAVGVPISVEDRLWGVMTVLTRSRPLPPDAEARLTGFTELVATAIANAEARSQLTASRARIVAASDHARRRIERDLHDGAQQRLVSLALGLRATLAGLPPEAVELRAQLDGVAADLDDTLDELREIARGIHPVALVDGGLRPGLKALARRAAVPVRLDVRVAGRLPEQVEIAIFYLVSEALTNATRHAQASVVHVEVDRVDDVLLVRVDDDGRGGADLTRGSGLAGLEDRVEALGGRLSVRSAPGVGSTVQAELPLPRGSTDPGQAPPGVGAGSPGNGRPASGPRFPVPRPPPPQDPDRAVAGPGRPTWQDGQGAGQGLRGPW
jgi:signal transduction histidine kinase